MKKLILLLGVLCFAINDLRAQFVLTPNGLKCEGDNDYIVIEVENKTKEQLFDNTHLFASSFFISPHDVISVSGKEQITLNGVVSNIPCKDFIPKYCSANFTVTLLFKDGRIRVNTPIINSIYNAYSFDIQLIKSFMQPGIFKKNGKTVYPETKIGIEKFFNKFVDDLKQYIVQDKHSDW